MKEFILHLSFWQLFLFFIGITFVYILFRELKKWQNYIQIIRFRENIKPGEYCSFLYNGRKEIGYITHVWPDQNVIRVRHQGTTINLHYNEIFP